MTELDRIEKELNALSLKCKDDFEKAHELHDQAAELIGSFEAVDTAVADALRSVSALKAAVRNVEIQALKWPAL